jgi:hypothetical protein
MLIRFSVTRKDTGAPVPNARIEVEKAETVGFTDSQGKAEIVTYWSGNWIYSVAAPGYAGISGTLNNRDIPVLDFGVSLLYNAVSHPPTNPGEVEVGRVGTSCSILGQGGNGVYFYAIRHDRNGMLTNYHRMDWDEVKRQAERMPVCFEEPPPPPKTVDEVSNEVTTLQKMLNNTVAKIAGLGQQIDEIISKAETEAKEWTKAVDGIWEKLEGWLIERIVGILLKGLDREVEVMKKNGRT